MGDVGGGSVDGGSGAMTGARRDARVGGRRPWLTAADVSAAELACNPGEPPDLTIWSIHPRLVGQPPRSCLTDQHLSCSNAS